MLLVYWSLIAQDGRQDVYAIAHNVDLLIYRSNNQITTSNTLAYDPIFEINS